MRGVLLLGFFVVLTTSNVSHSQPDIESDTWVAIAGLDRALSNITQVGPPRANRTVGIFYFLTLCNDGILSGPYDISKILKAHPETLYNLHDPHWRSFYGSNHLR
ncbi:unnamed protein product [Rotaria sp. Silwood1]|nr:unnamed protein product [Rotaria sp. Silwood1]CAF3662557.1 unnamed protein product [Rotaria sp. Silwood1]CAF3682136.1 unnamed protein product [Rotaria sp. Silwood1]